MQYIVYLILGLSFLTFANSADKKELGVTPFISLVQDESKKQEDTITMIAGLPWHSDIDTAFAIASKENRNVIIMVGEDYCKWCTKMKDDTFTDTRIKTKLEHYTLVSVKRSDKSAIRHVPSFDGTIPSLFFMNFDREMIESVVGYFVADDLLSYIDEIEEL
ncbi:DUF255 domain-containing protein [Sulfurovum sp.]|uniref:DUF255 domain-containing protein n=1 Tax=Sulfurovum sp. TaxID=1969726 RepID=UPI002867B32D|nr:DUF255 domain-containing protein [Sulfurovum sp.]